MHQAKATLDSDRTYQIFKRESDNTTVCVEAVKGLHQARKSVETLKGTAPGDYFVFDPIVGKTIEPSEPSISPDPLAP